MSASTARGSALPEGPALVVLAAGASRRLGRPKALVPLGAQDDPEDASTPLARLLAAGAALGDPRPLVVSGADHAAIAAALPADAEVLLNPAWERGRTGGIALAAGARPGRDLCLAPVDVPLVPAAVFAALARAWALAGRPPRGWLAPRLSGTPPGSGYGHPVVVGRALLAELRDLPPTLSLRALRGRADPLLAVEVESAAILDDLDTPEDLARLRRPRPGDPPRGR